MALTTALVAADPAKHPTPFLAVLIPEGPLPPSLMDVDTASGGALSRLYGSGDFTGKCDDVVVLYPAAGTSRIVLIGLGKPAETGMAEVRRGAATAAKRARTVGVAKLALVLAPNTLPDLEGASAVQAMAEGLHFGAWQYTELKRAPEDPKPPLEHAEILASEPRATAAHAIGDAIGAGQSFARGVQVLPGNRCTPSQLADIAEALAERHGMAVKVLDQAAIEQEGMHALLAVAQGSVQEPRFIALEYRGAEDAPIVLVGKGVTFDTGGISIKPAPNMEDMKFDMSGAAAVLGTFEMLGRLKPRIRVVGLIPSAENMPSGSAYKPGDVVGSHFGKTIEVVNTDAEGRLLLADALSYARRYQPSAVVDAATLTGAIVIALGHTAAGVMGTDEELMEALRLAGERAGERVWKLPLWDDYRSHIKSDVADVKNSGGRPAGSITAGWFLREFVEGFPWAHVDIAGTAYSDKEDATRVKGPTGFGVRLFSEFVLARAS